MTQMRFCYCCQTFHAQETMRQFQTRVGRRWRCLNSIRAAERPQAERDGFGRQQSELNRHHSQRSTEYLHRWQRR